MRQSLKNSNYNYKNPSINWFINVPNKLICQLLTNLKFCKWVSMMSKYKSCWAIWKLKLKIANLLLILSKKSGRIWLKILKNPRLLLLLIQGEFSLADLKWENNNKLKFNRKLTQKTCPHMSNSKFKNKWNEWEDNLNQLYPWNILKLYYRFLGINQHKKLKI